MAKPIDYNKLNSAAKLIHDTMYQAGFTAGVESVEDRDAKDQAIKALRAVKALVVTALKMENDDQIPNGHVSNIAMDAHAIIYTMCPESYASVYTIMDMLKAANDLTGALVQIKKDLRRLDG